jgi:2-methylcitrate dehydratase PrpD
MQDAGAVMAICEKLAGFGAAPVAAPGALVMMRLSLLDWAVCAIAARDQPVAGVVRALVAGEGGVGEAGVVGSALMVPARAAALANGTISHALDFDDTHFGHIGHPSVAVVPAALALAQKVGASGADFLAAALVGVEASVRVGLWLGRGHYQAGFHQTATAGAFGAALAGARLLGLEAEATRHALGLAAGRASGLKAQFGSMAKPLNAGMAAANGVEAALLASLGMQAGREVLDGAQGFGATHAGAADMRAFDGLGEDWLFEGVSHKFHACCHGLHAMAEALAAARGDLAADAVEAVAITTHPRWQSVCDIENPATGLEAKFSYRQVAAMVLAGVDTAALASYSDALVQECTLADLRERIEVRFDAGLAETATRVELRLKDGGARTASHDLAAPMPVEQRAAKLHDKAVALVGRERHAALWAAIQAGPDLAAFSALLAAA